MTAKGESGTWRDFLPLSAVLFAGLALSVGAFEATHGYYQTQSQQQFRRNAAFYSTSFKDDIARHVTSLAAIRAFVSASRTVTRWEFSAYAHQILPRNLGFKAILWVPGISSGNRQAYETALQQDGLYGLRIRELTDQNQIVEAADRASYLPVSYVEPFESNENLVGLDLSPIATFAEMFRTADQTGRVAASAPVSRALVAGTNGLAVFLAYALRPAPTTGLTTNSTDTAPQGYALGVLQLPAIVAEAAGPSDNSIQAAIAYRQNAKSAPVMLESVPSAHPQTADRWFEKSAFHQSIPFDIADRHFELLLRSVGAADPVTNLYVPAGAALLVLALTALLAQNMFSTVRRKQLVERAVVSRTAQLRAANEALRDEVIQRRHAESELRIARDRAESANRAKSSFLATMSHELRTPLNAIIGFSSILVQSRDFPNPRQNEYAGEILGSGQRLLSLINDILDLTQMDVPAAPDAPVYLADCIDKIVADAHPAAREAGVLLKASVPDGLPLLFGDSKRLTKALAHLVSNAVKFTPSGGAAVIGAQSHANGTIVIDVTDTGVGMPPEAKDKIRNAFSQYDGRLGRKYEGVGLGLTYVGKVAELHEAALDILSEAGKGTRIRLTFPQHRIARNLEVA